MSPEYKIILILSIIVIVLFLLWRGAARRHADMAFAKSSLSSKYGKMTEQFMPFLKQFPYDPQNFRFLGSPIDGVQFCEDKIVFIEFKTANSQMSFKQKQIAELIRQRRVSFEEHRLD